MSESSSAAEALAPSSKAHELAVEPLTIDERRQILQQAQVLIEQLYVHLPLKRAMHAIDPVQRLRLLDRRLSGLSDRAFHNEMIAIFVSLRDLHTNYLLPEPYASDVAYLPFLIEEYWDDDTRRYAATKIQPTRTMHALFTEGVEITHWNGVPIERAVALNGELNGGSNPEARRAQGLDSLTQRWMAMLPIPDEEWVTLTFKAADGSIGEEKTGWRVESRSPAPTTAAPSVEEDPAAGALGLNLLREETRRAQKVTLAPEAMERERAIAAGPEQADVDLSRESRFSDALEFKTITGSGNPLGYLRIRTFTVSPAPFVEEVLRILELLPQGGLIIDVRGNGGGIIMSGELLLQLFTPRRIEPESMCFINTRLTEKVGAVDRYKPWLQSIEESVETASPFSDALHLAPNYAEICNSIGQRYYGPVALVTDALCYSTTDIFAAGFQDHEIGPVIGTSGNTGAGGANVWPYEELNNVLPEVFPGLPKGTSMRVAIRRTTRVGKRAGDPIEDLGIIPDHVVRLTRRDLLEGNVDMVAAVREILAGRPIRALEASMTDSASGLEVAFRTIGIDRVDAYVNGRPLASWDVVDGQHIEQLSLDGAGPQGLELRGFAEGEQVALRKLIA